MTSHYTTCRTCGSTVPEQSYQGAGWHRECADCFPKDSLPTSVHDARVIAVSIDDRWCRVLPHLSNDGHLAMRVLKCSHSYVLMPDGSVRMRPDDFVMPAGIPVETVEAIERSFLLTGLQATEARRIFEAYHANDFEVIDS